MTVAEIICILNSHKQNKGKDLESIVLCDHEWDELKSCMVRTSGAAGVSGLTINGVQILKASEWKQPKKLKAWISKCGSVSGFPSEVYFTRFGDKPPLDDGSWIRAPWMDET